MNEAPTNIRSGENVSTYKIVPLSETYLSQASELANSVFPNEPILPSQSFKDSLDKDKFSIVQGRGVVDLEYFVAVDKNGKVLGTTGIYSLKEDEKDSCWMGWYCVDEKSRGQGVGKSLLDFCIDGARNKGKKYLKLYTSTHPNEATAQILYENNGFKITGREKMDKGDYEKLYRQKEL